jgi:hypothetical protein
LCEKPNAAGIAYGGILCFFGGFQPSVWPAACQTAIPVLKQPVLKVRHGNLSEMENSGIQKFLEN